MSLEKMVIDCSKGDKEPTITLVCRDIACLDKLIEVFSALGQAKIASVNLAALDFVDPGDLSGLTLQLADDGKEPCKTVRSIGKPAEHPTFSWVRDREGWLECADKVAAMIVRDCSGQRRVDRGGQDLSTGYYNDADIELEWI